MDFDFKNEFYATRGDDLYLVADGVVLDKEYGGSIVTGKQIGRAHV